jgi:hypothetical protein
MSSTRARGGQVGEVVTVFRIELFPDIQPLALRAQAGHGGVGVAEVDRGQDICPVLVVLVEAVDVADDGDRL